MTSSPHVAYRTHFGTWAIAFSVMVIATGFIEIYPDHRLWLVWLLAPLIVFLALVLRDGEALGDVVRLGMLFWILLGTSWVVHCAVLWLIRTRGRRSVDHWRGVNDPER